MSCAYSWQRHSDNPGSTLSAPRRAADGDISTVGHVRLVISNTATLLTRQRNSLLGAFGIARLCWHHRGLRSSCCTYLFGWMHSFSARVGLLGPRLAVSFLILLHTGRAPLYDAGIIDEASISFTHRHITSSRTVLPVLDLAITTRGPSCAADGICETYPWHRHHVAAVQNICSRSCPARYVPPARIDTNTSWYRGLLAVPVSFARLHLFSAVSLSGVGCPISCAVSLVTRPLRCR